MRMSLTVFRVETKLLRNESLNVQDMLPSKSSLKRRLQIVELVRKRGEVSVEELSQVFDVSSVTVRSDLTYLEQQRYLVRSFGKARYLAQKAGENILAPVVDEAARKASEIAIARVAAESVDDHESVMLGAGALVHKILPFLSDRSNLALTLHDLEMARTAQRFVSSELALTGGQLENDGAVLTGPDAEALLSRRSIDLCVLQADGLDREGNLLSADPSVARLFAAAQKAAKRTIVVAYQPQLNERDGESFAKLDEIDVLVMDDGIDPPTMELMPQQNLKLHRRESGILEFRKNVT
jgi:DeoR/GlpR family transcriptional regulator of sugar metabolism